MYTAATYLCIQYALLPISEKELSYIIKVTRKRLIVAEVAKIIPASYVTSWFLNAIQKSIQFDRDLCQLNLIHILTPCNFKIRFDAVISNCSQFASSCLSLELLQLEKHTTIDI
jgi:hypothetical protein